MSKFIVSSGQKFGRLTVCQNPTHPNIMCICQCGKKTSVKAINLIKGKTKSCGCLHKQQLSDRVKKHGATSKNCREGVSTTYKRWRSMKSRCTNKNTISYENYGGNGITICERWLNSFDNFLSDMGECPTSDHTLDRINSLGNYTPENCRWANRKQQNRNTSSNRLITLNGVTHCASEWAEIKGINYRTIITRLNKNLDPQEVLHIGKLPRKTGNSPLCEQCLGQKIIWNDNTNSSHKCHLCT